MENAPKLLGVSKTGVIRHHLSKVNIPLPAAWAQQWGVPYTKQPSANKSSAVLLTGNGARAQRVAKKSWFPKYAVLLISINIVHFGCFLDIADIL